MSASNNAGLPAFGHEAYYGLTKREYFAIMALQAILAKSSFTPESEYLVERTKQAIHYADALISELEREPFNDF